MIDFSKEIAGLDGKVIPFRGDDGEVIPATVRTACVAALLNDTTGQPGAEEKARRFIIANRIHGDAAPELSVEEISVIKRVVGNIYPPLVVGRVWEELDPAALKV